MDLINDAPGAPKAIGPYSQAAKLPEQKLLYCSGQIPIDPTEGKITGTDVESQTRQVFANIRALLSSQVLTLQNVAKTTVFLQSMADFPKMNHIYEEEFQGHKPARSTVAVAGLPLGALVEIEVIATLA